MTTLAILLLVAVLILIITIVKNVLGVIIDERSTSDSRKRDKEFKDTQC